MQSVKISGRVYNKSVNTLFETPDSLKILLQSIVPIPETEWDWLAKELINQKYLPGDKLFELGGSDSAVHFLCKGLVRYY